MSGNDAEAAARSALRARHATWPERIEWHPSVDSTNDVLRERARGGAPAWTVVAADRQTAGRGRQGRSWVSAPGNLHLSVLLRPQPAALDRVALLPLLAGIAVAEAIAEWGVDARLKWPNDLVVGERKLAGILAESASGGGSIEHVVLGIGANLAPPAPELGSIATSVSEQGGRVPSAPEAAAAVLATLRRRFDEMMPGDAAAIVSRWRERSVEWWGCEVEVVSGETRIIGRAVDLDASGALLLSTGSGTMRVLSGDARALRRLPDRVPGGRT